MPAYLHLFSCPIWSSVAVCRTLRDRMCLLNITKIVDLNVAMDAFDAFAIASGVASSIPFYQCSFVCVRGLLIGEFAIRVYVWRFEDYLVSL
jgi:hypothetical protein